LEDPPVDARAPDDPERAADPEVLDADPDDERDADSRAAEPARDALPADPTARETEEVDRGGSETRDAFPPRCTLLDRGGSETRDAFPLRCTFDRIAPLERGGSDVRAGAELRMPDCDRGTADVPDDRGTS
jgi:hypothetical protein